MAKSKKKRKYSTKGIARKKDSRPSTFSLYRGRAPKPTDVMLRDRKRKVLVFDETGSIGPLGPRDDDPRKDFAVVASFVEDAVSMSSVRKKFPKKKGEYKYKDATLKDAVPIFDELAKQDFEFSERHRSRRNQSFHTVEGARGFYVDAISEMIDEGAPDAPFDVLIDVPPMEAYEQLSELCKEKIGEGKEIEWFDVAASDSDALLQVHDFVAGSVGGHVNKIGRKAPLYEKIRHKRYGNG